MPHWLGSADLQKVRNDRFDIIGWTAISEWDDVDPRGSHVGAATMFSQPLPMEYPSKVNDLIEVLKDVGVEFGRLYQLIRLFALKFDAGAPPPNVLGDPMRQKPAGEDYKQHQPVVELPANAPGAL